MKQEIVTESGERHFNCDEDLKNWLTGFKLTYLLAHAEDGVIWGRFDEGKLTFAHEVFTKPDFPKLRLLTLQQCRIFGRRGEVLLWNHRENWKWRFIDDSAKEEIEERQILWGTHGEKRDGFTLLWDGSQGLKHAVPLSLVTNGDRKLDKPVRLIVYHYINYDEDGLARISLSRLVDLTTKERDNEKNATKN